MDYLLAKLFHFAFSINEALAQGGIGNPGGGGVGNPGAPSSVTLQPPFGISSFGVLFDRLIGFAVGLAIAIAPFLIVYAGYLIMFAGDNPKNYENGMKTLRYTAIGLTIVILSAALVNLLQRILQ